MNTLRVGCGKCAWISEPTTLYEAMCQLEAHLETTHPKPVMVTSF